MKRRSHFALLSVVTLTFFLGCKSDPPASSPPDSEAASIEVEATPEPESPIEPIAYEVNADALLSAVLSPELLEAGWVRLFDGYTLDGWFMVGTADWKVRDECITVSRGERSYLCTNFQLADYELQLEFRSNADTNSGVFLRTSPQPEDVATECLELNIAPPDNPFPTGSIVQRKKVEPSELGDFDATQWHTYLVRLEGEDITVRLDGKTILELKDATSSRRGYISLQHNSGEVSFRNILLRPIDPTPLHLDASWEEDWVRAEKEEGTFSVEPEDSGLHLKGGLGKLQSKRSFGDFILQAKYTLAQPEVNSGIFFRCIEDAMLDGYECQVNHAIIDGDPLRPADAGAGAIFRRKPARMVIGDGTQPTYITLMANGPQMMTWVNGVQTLDFTDQREPDDNPRKGLRTESGPIALQGHDPTTDVIFHRVQVSELR